MTTVILDLLTVIVGIGSGLVVGGLFVWYVQLPWMSRNWPYRGS